MANRHGSSIKVLGQQVFVYSKVVLRAAVWFHHAMLCYAMLIVVLLLFTLPLKMLFYAFSESAASTLLGDTRQNIENSKKAIP